MYTITVELGGNPNENRAVYPGRKLRPNLRRVARFDSPYDGVIGGESMNHASPYTGTAAPLVTEEPSLHNQTITSAMSAGSTQES